MKKKICIAWSFTFIFLFLLSNTVCAKERNDAANKVIFNNERIALYTKQTCQLKIRSVKNKDLAKKIKWLSSNPDIASVNETGKVAGHRPGMVRISAVLKENKQVRAKCRVKVIPFKKKTISKNIAHFEATDIGLKWNKSQYRVITSYKKLTSVLVRLKKDGANKKQSSGYSLYSYLRKHKKSYFKENQLCILKVVVSSISQKLTAGIMKKDQSENGRVTGYLHMIYSKPMEGEAWFDMQGEHYFIAEMKKSAAKGIDSYLVEAEEDL